MVSFPENEGQCVSRVMSHHPFFYPMFRSVILNDVAASGARSRPQVTKTLLVLGKSLSQPKGNCSSSLCIPICVM